VNPVSASQEAAGRTAGTGPSAGALSRHVPSGARVLLLGPPGDLVRALGESGCTVLALDSDQGRAVAGGASLPSVVEFAPEVVVALDLLDEPAQVDALRRLAPAATLLIVHWNSAGAAALLSALAGSARRGPALPTMALCESLSAAGYASHAEAIDGGGSSSPLASDLDGNLRAVFRQLNEWSRFDRALIVARPGHRPASQAQTHEDRLLTVVTRTHRLDRLELLDQAVFSLVCQRHRPLELIVATQSAEPDAVPQIEALLRRHEQLRPFAWRVLHEPSERDIRARLLNLGIAAARGRYLAFLDDDDVVYPDHYERLIEALRRSGRAWAFARSRWVDLTRDARGALYVRAKSDFFVGEAFDRAALLRHNHIALHSYVVDRHRLGRFPLRFPESMSHFEDYALLLQLVALFEPQFVAGAASCEYRVRDDGTNTIVEGGRAEAAPEWERAFATIAELKREIKMVASEHEVLLATGASSLSSPRNELRYRIVDQLNARLKRLRFVHGPLKTVGSRLLRLARGG
jgi:hypothetical protein